MVIEIEDPCFCKSFSIPPTKMPVMSHASKTFHEWKLTSLSTKNKKMGNDL